MILLIDNYDSFTYNLYQIIGKYNTDVRVIKNDELTAEEICALDPSHIIISSGSGKPEDAGVCKAVVKKMGQKVPLLGVCLGHQVICESCGAEITDAGVLMHGKKSTIYIANGNPVFTGLPPVITGARYHSLSVKRETLPDDLLVIAEDGCGDVMGVKHKDHHMYGLQFHPESILTDRGETIIDNFLKIKGSQS